MEESQEDFYLKVSELPHVYGVSPKNGAAPGRQVNQAVAAHRAPHLALARAVGIRTSEPLICPLRKRRAGHSSSSKGTAVEKGFPESPRTKVGSSLAKSVGIGNNGHRIRARIRQAKCDRAYPFESRRLNG